MLYFTPILALVGGYGLLVLATQEAYPFTIVTGTSMQPTILPGSVALIDRVPFHQLEEGNIIVFTPQLALMYPCDSAPQPSLTDDASVPCFVIHRIVEIQNQGQPDEIITTKGDANPGSISLIDTNITQSMYVGKVVLQLPLLGYVTEKPYNEYAALAIFGALLGELFYDRKMPADVKRQTSDSTKNSQFRF